MLNEIAFERFKAFSTPQKMELRPITILFGRNSVGKSAALRLLPFLAASSGRKHLGEFAPTVFDYSSPAMRGATLSEIISLERKGELRLALSWNDCRFEFSVRDLGLQEGELITRFQLEARGEVLQGHLGEKAGTAQYDVIVRGKTYRAAWAFDGLRPALAVKTNELIVSLAACLSQNLNALSSSVHWLSSVRKLPPRFSQLGPGTSVEIASDGLGVAAALHKSWMSKDGVVEKVSAWLRHACGCELVFAQTEGQVSLGRLWFDLSVQSVDALGTKVSIQDVGEGVTQALPVVTLCRQAQLGLLGASPILAFEQPELHLHPRAEQHLAEELVDCVGAGSPATHLIETHSEAFLLAVQIALVEKRIRPEMLRVYWIAQNSGSSALESIDFDAEGYPSEGWPVDVFAQSVEQARRLARLRLTQ